MQTIKPVPMVKQKVSVQAAIQSLGTMADDFLLNFLLLKATAPQSKSLPFLQAHTLELVAKCALIKIENRLDPDFLSHKVLGIYKQISRQRPEVAALLPSINAFANYRTVYVSDTGTHQEVKLPEPTILEEYELAFFLDNLPNLKYGFSKKFELMSILHISSPEVNYKLRELISTTRAIYANQALNAAALESAQKVFGTDEKTLSKLKTFLGISD